VRLVTVAAKRAGSRPFSLVELTVRSLRVCRVASTITF